MYTAFCSFTTGHTLLKLTRRLVALMELVSPMPIWLPKVSKSSTRRNKVGPAEGTKRQVSFILGNPHGASEARRPGAMMP